MKKTILLATIILLLIIYFTDWSSREEKIDKYLLDHQVLSVKNLVTATDEMAQAWEKNSYLQSVFIIFGRSKSGPVIVFYESPTQPNIGLFISIHDGESYQERMLTKMDPSSKISRNDWTLDSQDILKIVMNQKDVFEFAKNHLWDICGSMGLSREERLATNPLLWRVIIDNCKDPITHISIYLDPITGDRINDANLKW